MHEASENKNGNKIFLAGTEYLNNIYGKVSN
jgi:hypothetical protein